MLPADHDRFDRLFQEAGEAYKIPWKLLKAQAIAESGLNPYAVSRVGACGIAQFMPRTWDEVAGADASPFNPRHAIYAQGKYMKMLHRKFSNFDMVLAAYNWGMGNLEKHVNEWGELVVSLIPHETRQYLERIYAIRAELG